MKRSKYFLEGYEACKKGRNRSQNPYAAGQPWLSESPWPMAFYKDWLAGWQKCFYGEPIDSEP